MPDSERKDLTKTLSLAAQCTLPFAASSLRNITPARPVRHVAHTIAKQIQKHVLHDETPAVEEANNITWVIYIFFIAVLFSMSLWYAKPLFHRCLKYYGLEFYVVKNFTNIFPFAWYKGTAINILFWKSIRDAKKFDVQDGDVFVASFPRSGTTWTQELVYLIAHNGDTEKANKHQLNIRFPYFEDPWRGPAALSDHLPGDRFFKTHLPCHMLPQNIHTKISKIIYVMRNPKDVIVSNYHFLKMIYIPYSGTFSQFCDLFLEDKYVFSPWWKHVKEYWEMRHQENVLVLKYESIQTDVLGTIMQISRFLGKELTAEQIETILQHCTFEQMKVNPTLNHHWWDEMRLTKDIQSQFIRKGKVGDWVEYFSPSDSTRVDKMVTDHLAHTGLAFDYHMIN